MCVVFSYRPLKSNSDKKDEGNTQSTGQLQTIEYGESNTGDTQDDSKGGGLICHNLFPSNATAC